MYKTPHLRSNYYEEKDGTNGDKLKYGDKNLAKIAQILNVSIKDLYDFEHLKSDKELKTLIKKELEILSSKELQYVYKTIKNIALLRNKV